MKIPQLKDDLGGNWWHYIRFKDFGFLERIPDIRALSVSAGDVFIHKQIKKGDRFPTIRYHLLTANESKIVQNRELKQHLAEALVEFVRENEALPFACTFDKFFKNGNAQIKYTPTEFDTFALKIIPKNHKIDNAEEFFSGLMALDNPLEELKKTESAADSKKAGSREWKVPSSSDPSKNYTVTCSPNGNFACTCPHHVYRRAECKHIKQVKESLK